MMRRRRLLGAAAGCLLIASPATRAQQQTPRTMRIAWISVSPVVGTPMWSAFLDGLRERGWRERGWIEGQNFSIDFLLDEAHDERLAGLVAEAVRRRVDLIVCAGTPAALAARQANVSTPVLFVAVGDPVGSGIVASLAHPGFARLALQRRLPTFYSYEEGVEAGLLMAYGPASPTACGAWRTTSTECSRANDRVTWRSSCRRGSISA